MGSGASAPFESVEAALAAGKSQQEIDVWIEKSKETSDQTVTSSRNAGSSGSDLSEPHVQSDATVTKLEDDAVTEIDWAKMFAHKGDYKSQLEKFGPEPDYTSSTKGWYWYGQVGSTGPELKPEHSENEPNFPERLADVFYVHPTTYLGDLWNMPLADTEYRSITDFYVTCESSAFNESCRIFAPKFRQAVITAMGNSEEGKLATEFAYADVKKAFEYYIKHENKGRPFVLASHSQGSLYTIRLMLDYIEMKPLFNQFVACYGIAAWAPLSLFEGETAVFKQIKVSRCPSDVGCFISWTCEHPETVKKHCMQKALKEPGDWYPQMGHKIAENDWRIAHGEPIVCTHPLTWVSNGLINPAEEIITEEWLGMMHIFDGGIVTKGAGEIKDMDTMIPFLYKPNAEIEMKKISRMEPTKFNSMLDDEKTKFVCSINQTSGDLAVVALPVALGGSMIESYEHLNFLLFWFNIRKNVAKRIQTKLTRE